MSEIGSRNTCCVIASAALFRVRSSSELKGNPSWSTADVSREFHATRDRNLRLKRETVRREKPIRASRMRQIEEVAATREQRRMEGGEERRPFETESLHCETGCCCGCTPSSSASASIPMVINSLHAVTHNKWQSRWIQRYSLPPCFCLGLLDPPNFDKRFLSEI